MKKKFYFTFIFAILIGPTVHANSSCDGLSSVWKFDQINTKVSLVETTTLKDICSSSKKHLGANILIELRKGLEVISSKTIYWSSTVMEENFSKGKISGKPTKKDDFKIVKFTVSKSNIDNYIVRSIQSGKVIGSGRIE